MGERLAPDERHIAVQNQHDLIVRDLRHGLSDRMTGAQPLILQHPRHRFGLQRLPDLIAAVPIDDMDRGGLQEAGRFDDMLE